MSTFKVGDTVRLKSGGPKMTVNRMDVDNAGNPEVWVDWFADNEPKRHYFYPEQLDHD